MAGTPFLPGAFALLTVLPAGALSTPTLVRPPSSTPAPSALQDPAALVIIVNPASGVTRLTQDEVINLFMGRERRLPSGLVALPVEPVGSPEIRQRFYERLIKLPLVQVKTYWARMYFSGLAQPPRQVRDSEEVIEMVLANKGAVGFVERSKVDSRVRPVLVLGQAPHP